MLSLQMEAESQFATAIIDHTFVSDAKHDKSVIKDPGNLNWKINKNQSTILH